MPLSVDSPLHYLKILTTWAAWGEVPCFSTGAISYHSGFTTIHAYKGWASTRTLDQEHILLLQRLFRRLWLCSGVLAVAQSQTQGEHAVELQQPFFRYHE